MDTIKQITAWFETAKPNPNEMDFSKQLGCFIEEVAEVLECLKTGDASGLSKLNGLRIAADGLAVDLKGGRYITDVRYNVGILKELCDVIVTCVGVAYMLGYDIEGALQAVAESNDSKFENGKPVFNEQGKIIKGAGYIEPDLERFIK